MVQQLLNWCKTRFVTKEPCNSPKPARAETPSSSQHKATTPRLSSLLNFLIECGPTPGRSRKGTHCSGVYLNQCSLLMTSKRALQQEVNSGQVSSFEKTLFDGCCSKIPYPSRAGDSASLNHKSLKLAYIGKMHSDNNNNFKKRGFLCIPLG